MKMFANLERTLSFKSWPCFGKLLVAKQQAEGLKSVFFVPLQIRNSGRRSHCQHQLSGHKMLSIAQLTGLSPSDSRARGPGLDARSSRILSLLLPLIQEGQLSVSDESVNTKYWLTA